jgi:5-methyltetrahydropteroyltriglutamate--homocysteine methyltransferase
MGNLPHILTTSVIGSYALPAWLHTVLEQAQQGIYGVDDLRETQDDAVDLALRDQEDAGIDLITDGEMRRVGFFTAEFYGHMTGLEAVAARRRVGVSGHDQRESYTAVDKIASPNGLGLVAEYEYARTRTSKALKMPCPGPFTLAGRIKPGSLYKDRLDVAYALADIINAELKALVAAGVTFIQLDEPSYAVHALKNDPLEFIKLFNHTVRDVNATISTHICFGNFVGRPVSKRTYRPLFPYILDIKADQLALEFANRELAELDILREVVAAKDIAVGLVDVKNYYVETPEDVAERIREVLKIAPPEKVTVTPDCGFSQTARWAARAKLKAMVAGTKIVRRELGYQE